MNETLNQIRRILREMWHRRWIGLVAAWVVALIAIAVVYRIPERFEASARLYVDTESLLRPLLQGVAVQPNHDPQVSLISRTLISRPNVEKVVRMTDLDLRAKNDEERSAIVDQVMRTVTISGTRSMNLYVISYRDPSPEQARKVVQSMLTIFVESSLGDKQQDARSAVRFIDEQIRRYEQALQVAENRLKEFRLKYLNITPSEGQTYYNRLATLRGEIDAARLVLDTTERQRDAYRKELAGEQPMLIGDMTAPQVSAMPELDARIAAQRTALDELRRRFTDEHPDVAGTKRVLQQLEEQRKTELEARQKEAAARGPASATPSDHNPVFQQLRLSLAESEAQLAAARAKAQGLEQQYAKLIAQAKLVPEVEAELAQLNRDYEVQKRTYETLLARRESATMGIGVQDSGAAQFRVIDPPRVSPQPVAPNRLMLLGVALLVALGAGIAASFIAAQFLPTLHDSATLREITKRPVVGTVTMLQTPELRRRLRNGKLLFAGGTTALFAVFAAVVLVSIPAWRLVA